MLLLPAAPFADSQEGDPTKYFEVRSKKVAEMKADTSGLEPYPHKFHVSTSLLAFREKVCATLAQCCLVVTPCRWCFCFQAEVCKEDVFYLHCSCSGQAETHLCGTPMVYAIIVQTQARA